MMLQTSHWKENIRDIIKLILKHCELSDFRDVNKILELCSTLQAEAIPESLKNMLLVMDTAGIFQTGDDSDSQLWRLTWDRIGTFLPHLKEELFKPAEHGKKILQQLRLWFVAQNT